MPYYDYQCDKCHYTFTVQQGIKDKKFQHCINCGGYIRRMIPKIAVIFKGPGFYSTDNKKERTNKNS